MVTLGAPDARLHRDGLVPVSETGEHDTVDGIVEQLGAAVLRIDTHTEAYS